MLSTHQWEDGAYAGMWFAVIVERREVRRTGYCALGCVGHASAAAALAHHLQYQLDRETALWLDRRTPARLCEICGEQTTLRARLGRDTTLFVLCHKHQSTKSLEKLFHERVAREQAAAPAA